MVVMLTPQVLSEYVRKGDFAVNQAVKVVQDVLFNTSNKLYNLGLPLERSSAVPASSLALPLSDLKILMSFLDEHPSVKFLRLNYLDYTAMPRMRIVPIQRALALLQKEGNLKIGIASASLGILQNDEVTSAVNATGEYGLRAILSSIRSGPYECHASVQCEFVQQDNSQVAICPRSVLRRTVRNAKEKGIELLLGFEIEVVFMSRTQDGESKYASASLPGHAWNTASAFQGKAFLSLLNEIYDKLLEAGIRLEMFHPESCPGQYELVLPPLPPLEAVDTLLQARQIIYTVAESHSFRATLFPKPIPMEAGTGSHVHISISSPNGEDTNGDGRPVYESFYAGILQHLHAIIAFTYSNPASYDRMVDGCWAGGRWVAWGTQNRETPLRKIAGSHWEVKVLDGLANTYLAMAAIIAAGANGIAQGERLTWLDCSEDPATLSAEGRASLGIREQMPGDLSDAIRALSEDEAIRTLLGAETVERYIAVKRAEMVLLQGKSGDERRQWMIERF